MSYEAAEECQTDMGTLSDHPSEEEAATHSSGSDDDEGQKDTPNQGSEGVSA